MPTVILFHKENEKIIWAQAQPQGSAPLPPKEALLASANIPPQEEDNYDIGTVEGDFLNRAAQQNFRVYEGELTHKPLIYLEAAELEIDLAAGEQLELIAELEELAAGEEITSITSRVGEEDIEIPITGSCGAVAISLPEPGQYRVSLEDGTFRNTVDFKVKAQEGED